TRSKICSYRQIMAGKNDRHATTGKDRRSDLDQPPHDTPEIDRDARIGDHVCYGLVETASRGDKPVQPVERVLDYPDCALGTLIVGRQHPPQRFERLADNRDWRLEGVSVV